MIIAEGPDGGGKSSFLRHLEETTGRKAHHFGWPPASLNELLSRFEVVLKADDDQVFDRVPFISELVYRSALDDPLLLSDSDSWLWIDQLQEHKAPLIVYCRPSKETVIENVLKAADETAAKDYKPKPFLDQIARRIERIIQHYDQVIVQIMIKGLSVFPFNFMEDSLERTVPLILGVEELLEKRRKRN